jgi:hypothetical protein
MLQLPEEVFETHRQVMLGDEREAELEKLGVPLRRYVTPSGSSTWAPKETLAFVLEARKLSATDWPFLVTEEAVVQKVVRHMTLTGDRTFGEAALSVLRLGDFEALAKMMMQATVEYEVARRKNG